MKTSKEQWSIFAGRLAMVALTGLALSGSILSGLAQPVIVLPPENQTNCQGSTVTFAVEAMGTPPLTYQWRSHSSLTSFTNMPGETNAVLVVSNVLKTWRYSVVVSDASSLSVTSALVRVVVYLRPEISVQPAGASIEVGSTFTCSVAISSLTSVTYRWYLNDQPLAGKTNFGLTITNIQPSDAGKYRVSAANTCGTTNSQVAQLTVFGPGATFTKITTGPIATATSKVGCVAWGDYEDDGYVDLFAGTVGSAPGGLNALYRNQGNGTFNEVKTGPVADDIGRYYGAAWADFNNDGWLDLFVPSFPLGNTASDTNNPLFYQGGPGGQFTKITQDPLVTIPRIGLDPVWGDFDNDGHLDIFLPAARSEIHCVTNYLFRNTGLGGFIQVLDPVFNADGPVRFGGASDFDNDGDLDLLVSCDDYTRLFLRNNGDGTFTRITSGPIVNDTGYSAGFVWGDYDNDGLLDLCLATSDGELHLFHNDGDGEFTRNLLGEPSYYQVPTWVDYDNDGHLDLFVTESGRNRLFHNNGDGTFTELRSPIVAREGGNSCGVAWADYDNDGFADLVVANTYLPNGGMYMYHNNGNSNHWLSVRLQGTLCNRAAIGAKVRLLATIGGQTFWQMREISGGGCRSQGDQRALFGLGDATNAEIVRVEWPSGQVTELRNVASKQILTITEPPGLKILGKTADRLDLQVTAHAGMSWGISNCTHLHGLGGSSSISFTNPVYWISNCTHLHGLGETCPDTNGHWQLVLSGTNTSRTITVSDTNCAGASIRFYKAAVTK
jgi:hypothetical protein